MPCRDYRDDEPSYRPCPGYHYDADAHSALLRRLDTATRLACDRCSELEERGEAIPAFAESWWREHKQADERRRTVEKAAADAKALLDSALAKLTPDELRAIRNA